MKYFLRFCYALSLIACTSPLFAQTGNAIDKYLAGIPQPTIIGSASDNLAVPQDLKFSPVPSRKNELWVVNYGDYNIGGYMVIFYDAGKPTQHSEYRHDSHSAHFMVYPTALAMGSPDSAYFSTIGEALNSVGDNTSTFMGPVLWDSDTTKFARINQNDWVTGLPLGSHIDMLHQSPYSMGIAFDTLNQYWVFDGYHGCLYHYDFNKSHGYGGDDHSDGKILKYKEVKLKRIPNLPSHMIVDKSTGWLYIVDNGNKRIVRVDTRSGHLGNDLTAPDELLEQYAEMVGVKFETVDSGYSDLSGIAYLDGRLIVGNNGTGEILVYNTTTAKPTYLGTIRPHDAAGMAGLTIGPDSAIWYVNTTKNEIVRLTPNGSAPGQALPFSPANFSKGVPLSTSLTWLKEPSATNYHLQVSLKPDFTTTIYDSAGITSLSINFATLDTSTTYYWRLSAKNTFGEGPWAGVWHFTTIGRKPNKLSLISPANTAQDIPLSAALTWDSLKTVTSYRLQVSLQPDFLSSVLDTSGLVLPGYGLTKLAGKTKYFWRVRGINDGTDGDWSDIWSFTTLDPASVNENASMTSRISIDDIYPNPTSGNSTVGFTVREPIHIRVAVYDQLGKEISVLGNENFESGKHTLSINASSLASGTYYYQFITPAGVLLKPFVVR
ncbi:MAG: T9SS type A sorting domain-containing protein, partial [Candidatus Kapaibacterium sp.]